MKSSGHSRQLQDKINKAKKLLEGMTPEEVAQVRKVAEQLIALKARKMASASQATQQAIYNAKSGKPSSGE